MILYITTFNKALYDFSGKAMLKSFLDKKIEGDLFIGYEGEIDFEKDFPGNKFILYDLTKDELLATFLRDNTAFIPSDFGGSAAPCSCRMLDKASFVGKIKDSRERKRLAKKQKERKQYKGHIKGCSSYGYNRRASLWFRKIISLKAAKNLYEPTHKIFFFLDCDIVWNTTFTEQDLKRILKENEVGFLQGKRRKIPETGVVIYQGKGRELIEILLDEYMSGRYREAERWDDSNITKVCILKTQFSRKDIAHRSTHVSDVFEDSDLAPYMVHNKGTHSELMGSTPKRVRGVNSKPEKKEVPKKLNEKKKKRKR